MCLLFVMWKEVRTVFVAILILLTLPVLDSARAAGNPGTTAPRIGVLLVSHGSRSETWRNALLALEDRMRETILGSGRIQGLRSAFMEYNGPSIADQLKAFDEQQFTDVIIVPVFLTVSPHSFDDLPTIIGTKEDPHSVENLRIERIERYTPSARTHITSLLDFGELVRKNVLRRARSLSDRAPEEGLVLIAYGDQTFLTEWNALMDSVGRHVTGTMGMRGYAYGWCGHLVHYNPDSTTAAIERALRSAQRALVVPVLVAHDEMFQVRIIGDGIAKVRDAKTRVRYRPDAILPDEALEQWISGVVAEIAGRIRGEQAGQAAGSQ
jgi:sirohydrochlorin ferrochelatase